MAASASLSIPRCKNNLAGARAESSLGDSPGLTAFSATAGPAFIWAALASFVEPGPCCAPPGELCAPAAGPCRRQRKHVRQGRQRKAQILEAWPCPAREVENERVHVGRLLRFTKKSAKDTENFLPEIIGRWVLSPQ